MGGRCSRERSPSTETYETYPLLNDDTSKPLRVTTIAGQFDRSGYRDGKGSRALFSTLGGIDVHPDGTVYVTDSDNSAVRRISRQEGEKNGYWVDTLARDEDWLGKPRGLALGRNNAIVVTNLESHNLVKMSVTGKNLAVFAGAASNDFDLNKGFTDDRNPLQARFNGPIDVIHEKKTNYYFVTDSRNHCIRQISPSGVVKTIAGTGSAGADDGPGRSSRFNRPSELACVATGDKIVVYVPDDYNNALRRVVARRAEMDKAGDAYTVSTVTTGFRHPWGIAVDSRGFIYVSDSGGIKRVNPDDGTVETVLSQAQTGIWTSKPGRLAIDSTGKRLYFVQGHSVRFVEVSPPPSPSHSISENGSNFCCCCS